MWKTCFYFIQSFGEISILWSQLSKQIQPIPNQFTAWLVHWITVPHKVETNHWSPFLTCDGPEMTLAAFVALLLALPLDSLMPSIQPQWVLGIPPLAQSTLLPSFPSFVFLAQSLERKVNSKRMTNMETPDISTISPCPAIVFNWHRTWTLDFTCTQVYTLKSGIAACIQVLVGTRWNIWIDHRSSHQSLFLILTVDHVQHFLAPSCRSV